MEKEVKLTGKQKSFVEEYVKDFNATQAAIRAGYSSKTSYAIGPENLKKPEIVAAVQNALAEKKLSKDQTEKLITDIATASLNKYFKTVVRQRQKTVKVPLQTVIDRTKYTADYERRVASRISLNEKQLEAHKEYLASLANEVVRLEVELEMNPDAHRIELGEPELVEDVDLDLVALVKDQEGGRIKKFGYDKYGNPEVELYSADSALLNIAKINGLMVDRKVLEGELKLKKSVDLSGVSDEELDLMSKIVSKVISDDSDE